MREIYNYDDNLHTLKAKSYIMSIFSKKQFDSLLEEIVLTPLERNIIIARFKLFKSITQVAIDLYISKSTVYQRQRSALEKIYCYLRYKNYI